MRRGLFILFFMVFSSIVLAYDSPYVSAGGMVVNACEIVHFGVYKIGWDLIHFEVRYKNGTFETGFLYRTMPINNMITSETEKVVRAANQCNTKV